VSGKGVDKDSNHDNLFSILKSTDLEKYKVYAPCYGNSDLLDLLKK